MTTKKKSKKAAQDLKTANLLLAAGAGLGTYSAASVAAFGMVCPLCIVATPALIGAGVYGRIKAKKAKRSRPD